MKNVTYNRGGDNVKYLTDQQLADLEALLKQQQALFKKKKDTLGLGVPIYQMVSKIISDEQKYPVINPSNGVVVERTKLVPKPFMCTSKDSLAVWTWITNAHHVNSGKGFFGSFIRA
ncbi:hypothetical protein [Chitinivorax sp. B]|uniref:hypothetical protein n=1 Tax=Chitinivorax sp. B TaxID=2502235 RepID=UPI0010F5CEBE|nr:hypothetical protein [Chitinivorax sp. B]